MIQDYVFFSAFLDKLEIIISYKSFYLSRKCNFSEILNFNYLDT